MLIFGWPIKSVIHEKIKGDGIMSAIDCKIDVDVVKEGGADRYVVASVPSRVLMPTSAQDQHQHQRQMAAILQVGVVRLRPVPTTDLSGRY